MNNRPISLMLMIPFAVACSSGVPRSLADARTAYQRAAQGPAAQLTPAQLHVAQTSLSVAEQTYEDEGDSQNARDRAYVAQRKAELAEVQAAIAAANHRADHAARVAELSKEQKRQAAQAALESTRTQLAAEQARRQEAERRASEALSQLNSIASVKQESRGTVITLSGEVLFASGKAELRQTARTRLDEVAKALKQSDTATQFVVEGHTDSRGSAALNEELSNRRANTVREYLVSRGVPEDRISARGLGPSNPVADNETAEGRANNRRVEIVVRNDPRAQSAEPSMQPAELRTSTPASQEPRARPQQSQNQPANTGNTQGANRSGTPPAQPPAATGNQSSGTSNSQPTRAKDSPPSNRSHQRPNE